MRSRQADIVVTAVAAAVACVFAAVSAPTWLSVIVGAVLFAACGYLPGTLLFGSRITGFERVTVFTGLALVVPVLGGLLLYVAHVPLRRPAWLLFLAAVTLACDCALYLRRRSGKAEPFAVPRVALGGSRLHVAAFAAAVLVAILAVVVARVGVAHQATQQFTQLWLTADRQHADAGSLGVTNDQGSPTSYRLVLLRQGKVADTWNFTLANGKTWQKKVALTSSATITANLYRMPDLTHVYRYVSTGSEAVSS